jgi:hypothetical protein
MDDDDDEDLDGNPDEVNDKGPESNFPATLGTPNPWFINSSV